MIPSGLVGTIHWLEDVKDIMDIKAMLLAQKGRLDAKRLLDDAKGLLTEESWRELGGLVDQYG